ncbi:MAG: hypothetical protein COV72_00185 [Candidatus Omnitrophica bacterium CG11_big_fil_rev_8_21_14_0_20_42_13]|uniref:LysM domain-containing protein n=1 Tax=Candidatus Ghiorseimicrobium undicola TaxID=1974746 RepID=A0A2H0M215_9BACT|nr:MAG: hypothetical protein COV72_00185 [Candidatus Omnitrophica bacterium CG11_big_fil_rev_8_21_14_0_20_42_13]
MTKRGIIIISIGLLLSGCASSPDLPLEMPSLPRAASRSGGIYHSVKKGETLWRISKNYKVGLDYIISANNISDKRKIAIGQKIFIPGAREEIKYAQATSGKNDKNFIWPVNGDIISYYSEKNGHLINKGIDIKTSHKADISCARSGVVSFIAQNLKGYGKTLFIDHEDGFVTIYANIAESFVNINDKINQGAMIAKAGTRPGSNEAILHFEIRKDRRPQNPIYYLP